MTVSVLLEFKKTTSHSWSEVAVSAEDFFWEEPEDPVVQWDVGFAWKHDDPRGYLPQGERNPEFLRVSVRNQETHEEQVVTYHYWGGAADHSCLVDWRRPQGARSRELIHSNEVPHLENGSQVLRIDLSSEVPRVTTNVLLHGRNGDEFMIHLLERKD